MNTGSCCTRHSATGFSSPSVLKYFQGTLLMFHWRGIRDQYPAFCDRRFDQIVLKSSPDFSSWRTSLILHWRGMRDQFPAFCDRRFGQIVLKSPRTHGEPRWYFTEGDQYLTTHYRIFDQLQGIWSQIQTMPLLNPPGSKLNHFPPVTPITATFKQIRSQDRSTDNFVPSYHPTVQ